MSERIFFGLLVFVAGLVIGYGIGKSSESGGGTDGSELNDVRSVDSITTVSTERRYVHGRVNARKRPTTKSPVEFTLERGESVQVVVDSSRNGWLPIRREGRRAGWVAERLLEESPLPNIEIVDWSWRTDPDFGADGAVVWVVELRNNTDQYISDVEVRFSTYDDQGDIITSTTSFVSEISPHSTASEESYADYFGREERGRIQVLDSY